MTVGCLNTDINISSIYINPKHLQIFFHPQGFKILDISRSNRVRLKVNKNLMLKNGMVIEVGDHEIEILSTYNVRM